VVANCRWPKPGGHDDRLAQVAAERGWGELLTSRPCHPFTGPRHVRERMRQLHEGRAARHCARSRVRLPLAARLERAPPAATVVPLQGEWRDQDGRARRHIVPHKGDQALFWDPLAEFQLGHISVAKFSLPPLGFSPLALAMTWPWRHRWPWGQQPNLSQGKISQSQPLRRSCGSWPLIRAPMPFICVIVLIEAAIRQLRNHGKLMHSPTRQIEAPGEPVSRDATAVAAVVARGLRGKWVFLDST
jgi:hypothetical protein